MGGPWEVTGGYWGSLEGHTGRAGGDKGDAGCDTPRPGSRRGPERIPRERGCHGNQRLLREYSEGREIPAGFGVGKQKLGFWRGLARWEMWPGCYWDPLVALHGVGDTQGPPAAPRHQWDPLPPSMGLGTPQGVWQHLGAGGTLFPWVWGHPGPLSPPQRCVAASRCQWHSLPTLRGVGDTQGPPVCPQGCVAVPGHQWDPLPPSTQVGSARNVAAGSDPKRGAQGCPLSRLRPRPRRAAPGPGTGPRACSRFPGRQIPLIL